MSQGRLLLLGMAGRSPFAGIGWQVLHHAEGFRRLGWEVTYLEDTGDWPYDAENHTVTDDPSFTLRFLAGVLRRCGLGEAWSYRGASRGGQYLGPLAEEIPRRIAEADVLVNLTGATTLRDAYLDVPVRIYLETDPVLPQIEIAQGRRFTIDLLAAHTHHFTYGENIGRPGCGVPQTPFAYRPTRPPIILDWWTPDADAEASAVHPFSTIANWAQQEKEIEWDGVPLSWSKHHEFLKLIDLPARSGRPFELALSSVDAATVDELAAHGWQVRDAVALSADLDTYARFIRGSRGEFTVAKEQNIRLRSGWFSDRSASYLAAGRPVITQDTGFGETLPCGRGLFAFRGMDDVLEAVDAVESDYPGHCRAAREIAAEYFAYEKLLGRMLEEAGL